MGLDMSNGRPTRWYRWATDIAADTTEPTETLKNTGYAMGDKPTHSNWNYVQNLIAKSLAYLDVNKASFVDTWGHTGTYRVSGSFTLSQVAGLQGAISPGVVYGDGLRIELSSQELTDTGNATHNYTASKDTYLTIDPIARILDINDAIKYYEVANMAGTPAFDNAYEIPLGYVRTDATEIVSVSQNPFAPTDFIDLDVNGAMVRIQETLLLDNIAPSSSNLHASDRLAVGDESTGSHYISALSDGANEVGFSCTFPGSVHTHGVFATDGETHLRGGNTNVVMNSSGLSPENNNSIALGSASKQYTTVYCEEVVQTNVDASVPSSTREKVNTRFLASGNLSDTEMISIPVPQEHMGLYDITIIGCRASSPDLKITQRFVGDWSNESGTLDLGGSPHVNTTVNSTGETVNFGMSTATDNIRVLLSQTTTHTYKYTIMYKIFQQEMG